MFMLACQNHCVIGLAIEFERRRSERMVTLNAERVAISQPSTDDPPS
jgi:hypothetical protein